MSGGEAFQIVFGFSIPLFLALHFVGTGGSHRMFETQDNYAYILLVQWKFSDTSAYWQTLGLFAAWIHGCIGLYFWLRLKPWFQKLAPTLFAIAILLPAASWLGYYIGGKEVLALAEDREWLREALQEINPPTNDQVKVIYDIAFWMRVSVGGLIAIALSGRMVRLLLERRRG